MLNKTLTDPGNIVGEKHISQIKKKKKSSSMRQVQPVTLFQGSCGFGFF